MISPRYVLPMVALELRQLSTGKGGNMDEKQRMAVGRQVLKVRELRGMSQKVLAQAAGVAPNTVGSIEAGENVRPGSLSKVMAALEIEPEVETAWRVGLPADVHLLVEAVALWFAEVPEEQRPAEMLRLWRFLATPTKG